MPTPENLKAPFYADSFYHIVCKSIDGLLLFTDDNDYRVFLQRFKQFTSNFLDVWSYSQLPNHTHQIVKIKSAVTIASNIEQLPPENRTKATEAWLQQYGLSATGNVGGGQSDELKPSFSADELLERQMNSFLVSYANYYNNKYVRKGGLFQKPFKRLELADEKHLQHAVIYTNANAQKHQLTSDFTSYPHSSYRSIVNNEHHFVDSNAVQTFFGGAANFIEIHHEQAAYFYSGTGPSSRLE